METALALAGQATRIDPAVIPGWIARWASLFLSMFLTETGDWPEAENRCADSLARAREADDLRSETFCLGLMTDLDTRAGRIADAGRHLRESLELSTRIGDPFGLLNDLDRAGLLCAATRRWAEADHAVGRRRGAGPRRRRGRCAVRCAAPGGSVPAGPGGAGPGRHPRR